MDSDRIPYDELQPNHLYKVRVNRPRDRYEDYSQAVYKGDGEYWVMVRPEGKRWDERVIGTAKDRLLQSGTIRPVELVGEVFWGNDDELFDWLDDYHAGVAIERLQLFWVEIDPRWKTFTVIDLAEVILSQKDYSRLPFLHDALMDAGCDDAKLLQACQRKMEEAFALRIPCMILGGKYADALKWLEEFARKWNFSWVEMIDNAFASDGDDVDGYIGVTAEGTDLHGADELDAGDEEKFWECIELLSGKTMNQVARDNFGWGCSC